jgi:hypothetical protein
MKFDLLVAIKIPCLNLQFPERKDFHPKQTGHYLETVQAILISRKSDALAWIIKKRI